MIIRACVWRDSNLLGMYSQVSGMFVWGPRKKHIYRLLFDKKR